MEIKKILWPTDLSKNAAKALPYVSSLSERYGAEVHLLYVVEDALQFDHIYGDANPVFLKELQERISEEGNKYLEKVCQESLSHCPAYYKHIVVGDPANEILKAVEDLQVNIIVMATHGHGNEVSSGIRHFPSGSVSEKVIKNSPVPVLTVNPVRAKA